MVAFGSHIYRCTDKMTVELFQPPFFITIFYQEYRSNNNFKPISTMLKELDVIE